MSKSKKQFVVLAAVFALCLLLWAPLNANAAGLVPCGGPTESPCTVLHAFYMIARVTNWLIMMSGIYAVYSVANHSFWLAISAGNEEDVTKHKSGITNALIGMFVVLAAFMFMNTTVNLLLRSKCVVDFRSPWTYVTMSNPGNVEKCMQPGQPGYNPANNGILSK